MILPFIVLAGDRLCHDFEARSISDCQKLLCLTCFYDLACIGKAIGGTSVNEFPVLDMHCTINATCQSFHSKPKLVSSKDMH